MAMNENEYSVQIPKYFGKETVRIGQDKQER